MKKTDFKGLPEFLYTILVEMCARVGADINELDFKKENWYTQYSWTKEEEDSFSEWMIDYLYKNKEARERIMRFPRKNKKEIEKVVETFLFDFGWKTKYPEGSKE